MLDSLGAGTQQIVLGFHSGGKVDNQTATSESRDWARSSKEWIWEFGAGGEDVIAELTSARSWAVKRLRRWQAAAVLS